MGALIFYRGMECSQVSESTECFEFSEDLESSELTNPIYINMCMGGKLFALVK